MNEPLSLEIYTLSLAHLLRRRSEPIASVLGSLNITAEAFKQAEIYWTQQLEQSLVRRQGMLAMKFASSFAEARSRIGLLDPTDESARAVQVKAPHAPELPSFLKVQSALSEPSASPWAPAPQPRAAASQPTAPPPQAFVPAPGHLRGTALHDPTAVASQALPFQHGSPAPPAPPPAPLPAPRGPGTGTALLDSSEPGPQPVTPWASDLPALTLEQYASLVVELTRRPPNVEHVLTRYGLHGHEQHQRLESMMKAQLHGDPALRARYDALIMRFATMQIR